MYKISINLLPSELKEAITLPKKGISKSLLWSMGLIVLGFLLVFLFVNNYFLTSNLSLLEKNEGMYQEYLNLEENKKLQDVADKLNKLQDIEDKVQKEKTDFSGVLLGLNKAKPEGIEIRTFKVSRVTRDVLIEGIAKERKDLLDFTSSISALEKFKDVQAPAASLTQRFDIIFSIKAKLAL